MCFYCGAHTPLIEGTHVQYGEQFGIETAHRAFRSHIESLTLVAFTYTYSNPYVKVTLKRVTKTVQALNTKSKKNVRTRCVYVPSTV